MHDKSADNISCRLDTYVRDWTREHMRKLILPNVLVSTMTLESIGIDDLDLDVLMSDLITDFSIDHSKFEKELYFGTGVPLIDDNVPLIRKLIGNRKWLPRATAERQPFTLGVLDRAIETGVLT